MPSPSLFFVDYCLNGAEKSFINRLNNLTAQDAWHWASCDAGIGVIPKFGSVPAGSREIRFDECALEAIGAVASGQPIPGDAPVPR